MFEFLGFMLSIAWKILAVCCGFMLFRYVIRDGKDTFRDLLTTTGLGIQAGCLFLRRKLAAKIKGEPLPEEAPPSEFEFKDDIPVDGSVR